MKKLIILFALCSSVLYGQAIRPIAITSTGVGSGNGSGVSNAVDIIAGIGINVITGANNRSFTLVVTNFPGDTYFLSNVFNFATNFFNYIYVSNNAVFNGKVTINNQLFADGKDLTNIFEKNIVVTTNGWGNSVIDFSLGTQIDTNMSANLTITGIAGFVSSNLNWQTIGLNPNGADRVITVPEDWYVSGFTNATTVTLASTNQGVFRVETKIGIRTNASLEIYYR